MGVKEKERRRDILGEIHFHGWKLRGKTYDFRIKINSYFFLLISNMMFEMREKTIS